MRISRRFLIRSGAAAVAASATATNIVRPEPIDILVFDSRSLAGRAFAARGASRRIDVAAEDGQLWRSLRAVQKGVTVAGITRWNDFVLARGFLQDRGLRTQFQQRDGDWWRWSMS